MKTVKAWYLEYKRIRSVKRFYKLLEKQAPYYELKNARREMVKAHARLDSN